MAAGEAIQRKLLGALPYLLPPSLAAVVLFERGGQAIKAWSAGSFVLTAVLGLLSLLVTAWLAWRRDAGPLALGAVAIGGLLLAGACLTVLGVAVDNSRQNYWDAIHFASLLWTAFLASAAAAACLRLGRQQEANGLWVLEWASYTLLVVFCFAWSWTWFPPLQALVTGLLRGLYLLTHG